MRITPEILEAIKKASFELGSQSKLAELADIPQTNISKYLRGAIKVIRDTSWKRLYPHISKWLPAYPLPKNIPEMLKATYESFSMNENDTEEERDHSENIRKYIIDDFKKFIVACVDQMDMQQLYELSVIIRERFDNVYDPSLFSQGIPKQDQ